MVRFTPGLLFLIRQLPHLFLGFAILIGVKHATGIPLWILVPVAPPLLLTATVQLKRFRDRRAAAALGARLAPVVEAKWLGNIDITKTLIKSLRSGYPGDEMSKHLKAAGSSVLNFRPLWDDVIMTIDPQHIKIILATGFANYEKGSRLQTAFDALLGSGIFNSDGDMWKFHRSISRPFFSKDRISHFDTYVRHADAAVAVMKERCAEGYPVDVQDVMGRFTLQSATEFLLGSKIDCINSGLPYPAGTREKTNTISPADAFANAFAEAQEVTIMRERFGDVWPLREIFEDKMEAPMKVVNGYIQPFVDEAVRKKNEAKVLEEKGGVGEDDDELEGTLLDSLARKTSDTKILKDEVLNVLIAGRDTMTSALTFLVYFLATHPHALKRLREEILDKVGPTRTPTYDDIKDMKYLRATINETLRLYPPVPLNTRQSLKATTWPSSDPNDPRPIYIPADSQVPYSVFWMHREKHLWGPDADEFDPDRFIDERSNKYLAKNPFIFLPFNAGARICIGQQFAYNELSVVVIRLFQTFSTVSLDSEAQPEESKPPAEWKGVEGRQGIELCKPLLYLTMSMNGGLWANMGEAGSSEQ